MENHPFGYSIKNGKAVVDTAKANIIRQFFADYLSGMGLTSAAKKAGFAPYHGSAKRMLTNRCYLGDDFYPAIIDEETFTAAEMALLKRAEKLGRLNKDKPKVSKPIPNKFYIIEPAEEKINPLKQAEYLYSLIQVEVN